MRRSALGLCTLPVIDAAVAIYADTALNAFAEVESALDRGVSLRARRLALEKGAEETTNALRLSLLQYKEGEIDLIDQSKDDRLLHLATLLARAATVQTASMYCSPERHASTRALLFFIRCYPMRVIDSYCEGIR